MLLRHGCRYSPWKKGEQSGPSARPQRVLSPTSLSSLSSASKMTGPTTMPSLNLLSTHL